MTQQLLRDLAPQVLGILVHRFRDFAAAEDAVQEALLAASQQWSNGIPDNPKGWLIQVATRRMTDYQRAEAARRQREVHFGFLSASNAAVPEADEEDDTLALLFLCCHPSLTQSSAVALILRAVGGLTTAEIARAFLVPESTMAQRISRAKQTIKASGIPFAQPGREERRKRLSTVLHTLYLIFNEGYTSSGGPQLQRRDLANEAIRLTRIVHVSIAGDSEVAGLLALMLLTDARRAARSGPAGELIPLDQQDRSLWDRAAIAEGTALLDRAFANGVAGPYMLQAAIAALHDGAATAADTDWPQILALYNVLRRMMPASPMVRLNYAVAVAMVHGPAAGLKLLAEGMDGLHEHHRLHAVRGHLLELAGKAKEAIDEYRKAAILTASLPERNYLLGQAAKLSVEWQNK